MTKTFEAKIQGETFEDVALFEAAALEFRKAKRDAAPRGSKADWNVLKGENADLVARARGTWKAPKRREWVEPQGHEIGATRTLQIGGDLVEAQVWSEAPEGGSWVATDRGFFWVRKSDGAVYAGLPAFDNFAGQTVPDLAA